MGCPDWLSLGHVLQPGLLCVKVGRGSEFISPEPHGLRMGEESPQSQVSECYHHQSSLSEGMASALTGVNRAWGEHRAGRDDSSPDWEDRTDCKFCWQHGVITGLGRKVQMPGETQSSDGLTWWSG